MGRDGIQHELEFCENIVNAKVPNQATRVQLLPRSGTDVRDKTSRNEHRVKKEKKTVVMEKYKRELGSA